MVNPELAREIANNVYLLYANVNSTLQEQISKKVEKGIEDIPKWQSQKSKDLMKIRMAASKLARQLNHETSYDSLIELITQAYNHGILSADKNANLDTGQRKLHKGIVRIAEQLSDSLYKCNMNILNSVDLAYKQCLAIAASNVVGGAETVKQATQRYLNGLADKGVVTFRDKAGRNWNIATYAEMATRAASGNAMLQGHIDRQIELGRDLIKITSHAGSCPLCAKYQGVILSISGTSTKYPSLESAQQNGLFHVGCEHSLTGYIEGVSKPPEPDPNYDPRQYDYIQKQRSNERQIRKWKDRLGVALDDKERDKCKGMISKYQKAQRDLLSDYKEQFGHTLRRHYDREGTLPEGKTGVFSITKPPMPRPKPIVKEQKPAVKTQKPIEPKPAVKTPKPIEPKPVEPKPIELALLKNARNEFKKQKVSEKYLDRMEELYAAAPDWYKNVFEKMKPIKITKDKDDAYYLPSKDSVAINLIAQEKDPRGPYTTLFHELGHKMDWNTAKSKLSTRPEYISAMKQDLKAMRDKYTGMLFSTKDYDKLKKPDKERIDGMISRQLMTKETSGISDVYGGLTKRAIHGLYGHSEKYWARADRDKECSSELFAHMSASTVVGGKRQAKMKEFFPTAYQVFEDILKGVK